MNKVVFLGSKEVGYHALDYLIKNAIPLKVTLVGVLSNDRKIKATDQSVIELAKNHHISVLKDTNSLLEMGDIDFLISVQYHEIIAQKHINTAKKLAINLHMAPLPEYRGCNQFSFAIIEEAKEFGTTIHVLDKGIDSGDILFEKRFPLSINETAPALHQKTTQASMALFDQTIGAILNGDYTRTAQQSYFETRTPHFHLRNEINGIKQIDLDWSDEKIDRYIRATYFPPFPPPYTLIDGEKVDLSLNWRNEIPR